MMRATWAVISCTFAGALALSQPAAHAEEPYQPPRPSHNMFGLTGLIETPTANVQPDGQITISSSYFGGFLRNTLSAQILPGLEVGFRYSVLEDVAGSANAPFTLFDRGFDIKLQLSEETDRWPALSIGLRDFLGTGVYSSEYVVASKGFDAGDFGFFNISGGVGWGRFADRSGVPNPLRGLDSRFRTRDTDFGLGGTPSTAQFFRGRSIGFFGGVEWQTPIDGLRAKIEYSPDQYVLETTGDRNPDLDIRTPINVGLDYRLSDGVEIGAYYLYGSEFGVRVAISGNPYDPLTTVDSENPPNPVLPREPLPNGAQIAGLGDVRALLSDEPTETSFADPRLTSVVVHTRLGTVRWAEAELQKDTTGCPEDLARAIDAVYGVIDVVTFRRDEGSILCTIALRPAGQHAVRLTSRVYANYPIDWYDNQEQREKIASALVEQLEPDSIGLRGIELGPRRVAIYIENRRFFAGSRAIGRTTRALTRTMPASVELFEVTLVEGSLPVSTVSLRRSQIEDQAEQPDAAIRTWGTASITDAEPVVWEELIVPEGGEDFPRYGWFIGPSVPGNFFDPDQPVRLDLALNVGGSIEFLPGLSVSGFVQKRIIGDLDEITRPSDSLVENRVRSEIAQYLSEGDPALLRLTVDYVTKLNKDVYGRVSAGMLERMFAGVSSEILWKPANQSWGLGLEVNYVAQRDFDTRFSLQDYRVATGHASFYWDTDFYDVSMQVDAGRYLAGDWGGTFALRRRFANGWELGGFFTLTTIPFDEFGEGSFDKGIFLTIPFNWFSPLDTRQSFPLVLRPLTRDGGARLDVANRLYPTVDAADEGSLRATWEQFWE
ncbi:MAG: YjbH domain-containing protein [Pseudomonadota bacterium]